MIAHDLIDLSHPRRLHLLGIGGSGMTPFARLLAADGHAVTGADARRCPALEADGIPVLAAEAGANLPHGVEGVIHSAAVPADHPAIVEARRRKAPVVKYARAVGLYARGKRTLAVAGTHGKTTTTAMLAYVLRRAGHDPSFLIGGLVPQLGGSGLGRSDLLAVEACEFDRSFLHFSPHAAIVTNLEADHLDYYKDLVEITAAFRAFATQVEDLLVLHESLHETLGRAGGVRARVKTFGPSPDADVRILPERGGFVVDGAMVRMRVPGFHNALNAASVLAVVEELGVARDVAQRAVSEFAGVGRRLQVVGQPRGVAVVDDYAHHPTEVEAGLRALRDQYSPRRLWVVFQPHQYSRLRRFLQAFADALATADRVIVPEVFAARDRDEDRLAVSASDLVAAVRGRGGHADYIPEHAGVVDFLRAQVRAGDVVVTMGAGDIGHVAGRLAEAI